MKRSKLIVRALILLGFGGVLGLGASGCGGSRAHRSRTPETPAAPDSVAIPDEYTPVRVMYGVRYVPHDRDKIAVLNRIVMSGTVTDADTGKPLYGALVMSLPDGEDAAVIADSLGRYSIPASVGDSLGFYYLGYTTQAVKVAGVELDVRLKLDSVALNTPIMVMYGIRPTPYDPGKITREADEEHFNTPAPIE